MITATRNLHFRDPRAPHGVRVAVERELMTLLRPAMEESRLTYRAEGKSNGVPYRAMLRLQAALPLTNCYLLQFEAAEKDLSALRPAGRGKYLDGWLDLWTRDFKPAPAPTPGEGSAERSRELAEQALAAEAHLDSVASVQQEIVRALQAGATFSTAHKEGGTVIRYASGHFQRADYGESSATERFSNEASFLAFLRKFYDWETSRGSYPEKATDLVAWTLMLRLLNRKG